MDPKKETKLKTDEQDDLFHRLQEKLKCYIEAEIMSQIYIEFEIDQGIDSVEILGKQLSLKGVQGPFSTDGNLDLLKRAGFVEMMTIMKSVSFEGTLAIK